MKTGGSVEEFKEFKNEATIVMGDGKFPVHKWEFNVQSLESQNMPNPGKILRLTWHKRDDVIEIQVPERKNEQRVTKKVKTPEQLKDFVHRNPGSLSATRRLQD